MAKNYIRCYQTFDNQKRRTMKLDRVGALVTGGASGLGEAIAEMLVDAGSCVVIADLPGSCGEQVAGRLGASAKFVATDVTAEDQVACAVEATFAFSGGLGVAVNCAGINPGQFLLDRQGRPRPLDSFREAISINLIGLVDVVRQAASSMRRNEGAPDGERGVIVNLASIAAFEGQPGQAAYVASKAGVAALTLQLAREFAPIGVRVMAIAPGLVDTQMIKRVPPARRADLLKTHLFPERLARPEEVADLVRFVIESSFLNGEVIRFDAAARLGWTR
jgi:NAD(P)-dependent dehydrogenase (short-subunit alcohol dehydrogenase family)